MMVEQVTDDAKDAARYRWLRSQFQVITERREHEEFVRQQGPERTYRTRNSFWHAYSLQDDWRFGKTTDDPLPPTLDALIDAAMKEES